MNFFQQLKGSVTNYRAYPELGKLSLRKTFLYMFILSSVLWIFSYAVLYYNVKQGIEVMEAQIVEDIPSFLFSQGHLEVEGPMPVVLYKDLTSIVMVDTSGKSEGSVLNMYRSGALILQDRIINKGEDGTIEEVPFPTFSGFTLSKDQVISWLPYLKWIYPLLAVVTFIIAFPSYLVNAFWISLIGLLLRSILNVNTSFSMLYKMSAYALTLSMVLNMLLPRLIFYIIGVVYIGLALYAMSRITENTDSTQMDK